MRRLTRRIAGRSWLAALAVLATAAPGASAAPPPVNDAYLASTQMMDADGTVLRDYRTLVDTAGATTQLDLLNPDSMGQPLGGGPPEPTTCGTTPFGATVWFDFHPESPGGVEIDANGFDTVVTVYEYNVANAAIKRVVKCLSTAGVGERLQLPSVQ